MRKKVVALFAFIIISLLPAGILALTGHGAASGVWGLAGISGLIASVTFTWRWIVIAAGGMAVASFAAVASSHNPWLAGLVMFAVALATSLTARKGLSNSLSMIPISIGFFLAQPPELADPADGLTSALLTGLVALVAFMWCGGLVHIATHHLSLKAKPEVSLTRSVSFALIVALEVGIEAWCVSRFGLNHAGAWLMLTTVVILQPTLSESWKKGIHRAIGTVIGVAAALVVSYVIPWTSVLVLIGIACIFLAVMFRTAWNGPYWRYVAALTPAIVLLEGVGTSVAGTALDRLVATLIGATAAMLTIAALYPLVRRSQAKHPPAAA